MRRHRPWMGLSLLLPLAACNLPWSAEKPEPEFKQNPQPLRTYQLALSIANAPGAFQSIGGFMQFTVATPECLSAERGNYGNPAPDASNSIPIVWTRVSDTEYTAVVHADGMLDEDYYGLGVCRWELIQAIAELRATQADGETQFMPSIGPDKLAAQQAETAYFSKSEYKRDAELVLKKLMSFGQTERAKLPHLQDDELFTITFTPKALSP